MDKKQIKENIVKIRNNGIKLWTEDEIGRASCRERV